MKQLERYNRMFMWGKGLNQETWGYVATAFGWPDNKLFTNEVNETINQLKEELDHDKST